MFAILDSTNYLLYMKLLLENWRRYIKEQSVLEEGITDVVFHKTKPKAALKILQSNKFLTSPAFQDTKDVDVNKGRLYYFSTMRSPQSSYMPAGNSVTFQLDGRSLGQSFKSMTVDYYKDEAAVDEMEDRILTDKPYIEPALKYISAMHVYIELNEDYGNMIEESELAAAEFMNQVGSKNNIPVHFYIDEKDYKILNKTKRTTFDSWKKTYEEGDGDTMDDIDYSLDMWRDLEKLVELMKAIQSGNEGNLKVDPEIKELFINSDSEKLIRWIQNRVTSGNSVPEARDYVTAVGLAFKKFKGYPGLVKWIKSSLSNG